MTGHAWRRLHVNRVVLACVKTDLRLGIDGLAAIVRLYYGLDPFEDGTLFLFMGRKQDGKKAFCSKGPG